MASIVRRGSKLFVDFRYQGIRCREATGLADTPANKKRLRTLLDRIEAEITLGSFEFAAYFPNSKRAEEFRNAAVSQASRKQSAPLFADFAQSWFEEKQIEWRESTQQSVGCALQKYLLPFFGSLQLDQITKTDILQFRKQMADPGQTGQLALSASRINHVMSALKMIIEEGADRFGFESPWRNIKRIRGAAKDVKPFTLPEVMEMINAIRPDYRNYLTVRFFTGMRTAEIDGLQWQDIDLERREINVRQGWVMGKFVPTKTDGSRRTIVMSSPVHQALAEQFEVTGERGTFVFCSPQGHPIKHGNFRNRVWLPLLRHLGYERRTPYHTRHTAATLWLAAGENPEWIARQLGHTNTEMLFRVYSRYVPNLTRNDGAAIERLISNLSNG